MKRAIFVTPRGGEV